MTRLIQGMPLVLLPLVLVSASCWTKPAVNGPDGRRCFPAVIDSETAMLFRATHPDWQVKAGDLIQTPECAKQDSKDRLNATYELTK